VLTQNPQATVLEVFTGSWDDVSKGYEATKGQMDAGADVIWQYLDLGAVGAANAVKETQGVWLISNTNDQSFLAPEITLTSALQGITSLIPQGVEEHEAGRINGGEFYRWGVKEGVAGLAPYHEIESKIPSALKSKIDGLKNQMIAGTFVVPEIYAPDGYKEYLAAAQPSTLERKAALVMEASTDDIGWGTLHYNGMLTLEDKLGYEIAISEKQDPPQWETAARDYAERGYKYVVMGGPQFTGVTAKIAPDYPQTTFLVTAAIPPIDAPYPSNMVGLDAKNEQSGYLAGVLAAGMTKTNKVGIVAAVALMMYQKATKLLKVRLMLEQTYSFRI